MREFQTIAISHNLEQLIKQPMRIFEQSRTLIDLISTNSCHHLTNHSVFHLFLSDPSMVYCVFTVGVKKAPGKVNVYRSYKSFNKEEFIKVF